MAQTSGNKRIGYAVVGVVLATIFIAFQVPKSTNPERFRLTFVQDEGEWININELSGEIPEDQMSFVNEIRAVRQEARGQTSSLRRLTWIDFNRSLCSTQNPFVVRRNWLGRISETEVLDDGTLSVTIEVADGQPGTTFYLQTYLAPSHPMIRPIVEAGSSNLRFSGSFSRGDITGDNECLDKAEFTDFPEIEGDSRLRFTLINVRLLPTETFLLVGNEYRTADYELASRVGQKQ